MALRGGYATGFGGLGWGTEHIKAVGLLARQGSVLPSFMGVTRGAGSWSRQTAPAVDGTTFIELGTSQNTPRFDYDPTSGRTLLLIEPPSTNLLPYSNWVDAAPNNNFPDGWDAATGVIDVDFASLPGGPHGGEKFVLYDTATAFRGVTDVVALAGSAVHTVSWLVRRTGTSIQASMYGMATDAEGWLYIDLGAVNHDWALRSRTASLTNGATEYVAMRILEASTGRIEVALGQLEAVEVATSRVPTTAGTASRAAELLTIDPSVVGRLSGTVQGLVRMDFASTAALAVDPVIHCWANGYKLVYDPADDKVKVVVAGTKRAESAALTFSRQGLLRWRVRYGAAGQELTIVGGGVSAKYTDATAWGDPGALAPYLGSDAASANCRPMAHGDYLSAA